ncbi:MAG: hypothetical protein HYW80_01185 [Parcubacteria group bacterium]|nr:hypothetical protein [Parcubacteria group bacterium]
MKRLIKLIEVFRARRRFSIVVLLIFLGVLLVPQGAARANVITDIATGVVGWAIAGAGYVIGAFFGYLISLEADLIQWTIDPANFSYTSAGVVTLGWGILRNFVNLGLVIALVVIAISTILRIESYNMRRTLLRLIAAAILVNFSLVIAGLFIDTSNLLTHYFVVASPSGGRSFSNMFANSFAAMSLLSIKQDINPQSLQGANKGLDSAFIGLLASVLFFVIFSLVAMVVLGALFVMLLIRTLALWLLLIVSPLAWLFWIFPKAPAGVPSKLSWSGWWEEFLKWNFFAPIVSFFIYLSFKAIERFSETVNNLGNLTPAAVGLTQATSTNWIAQYIIFTGMLVGSMWAAQQMGITGAKIGLDYAQGLAKAIPTNSALWLRRQALRTGEKPEEGKAGYIPRAAKFMARFPVLNQLGRTVTALQAREESRAKQEMEKLEKLNPELLARNSALGGVVGTSSLLALAKKNELGKLRSIYGDTKAQQLVEGMLPNALRLGVDDALKNGLKFDPRLAPRVKKNLSDVIKMYTREDIQKIPDEVWRDNLLPIAGFVQEAVRLWGPGMFGEVAQKGGELFQQMSSALESRVNAFAAGASPGDPAREPRVRAGFNAMGNPALFRYLKGTAGQDLYDITVK